jgi:hypothetical protein
MIHDKTTYRAHVCKFSSTDDLNRKLQIPFCLLNIMFLQAIVVYVKYLFMFQNDYKTLGHSVICSIDYWLLYVNRKFKHIQ